MKTTTTLLIAMAFASITVSAQTRFGITAGATNSNLKAKSDEGSESADYKMGFTTGIFIDMPMTKNFSFQPALNFTQKGAKYEDEYSIEKMTLNYFEVPLNFIYSFKPSQGLFIGAGPTIALGLSGKDKYEIKNSGEEDSEDIEFGSEPGEVKSFSFGGNFMAGYKIKNGLLFSAGYNFDYSNMVNNEDDPMYESSLKSNYISLKIGWTFLQKPNKPGVDRTMEIIPWSFI
jgi:hypothetical protein